MKIAHPLYRLDTASRSTMAIRPAIERNAVRLAIMLAAIDSIFEAATARKQHPVVIGEALRHD